MKTESIVVEKKYYGFCAICGRPVETEHQLIFGHSGKNFSEKNGLKIPCCDECNSRGIHLNKQAMSLSRMLGQMAWEKEYFRKQCNGSNEEVREEFRKSFGESYL